MTKRCPIMSKQNESHSKIYCFESECAFWDEEKNMCCIKSAAIAAADKSSVSVNPCFVSPSPAMVPNTTGDWHLSTSSNPYRVESQSDPVYTFEIGV